MGIDGKRELCPTLQSLAVRGLVLTTLSIQIAKQACDFEFVDRQLFLFRFQLTIQIGALACENAATERSSMSAVAQSGLKRVAMNKALPSESSVDSGPQCKLVVKSYGRTRPQATVRPETFQRGRAL